MAIISSTLVTHKGQLSVKNFFQTKLITNAHKFHLNDNDIAGFMQLFEKISVELIVSFPHVCPIIKKYAQDDALFRSTFLSGMAETFLNLLHPWCAQCVKEMSKNIAIIFQNEMKYLSCAFLITFWCWMTLLINFKKGDQYLLRTLFWIKLPTAKFPSCQANAAPAFYYCLGIEIAAMYYCCAVCSTKKGLLWQLDM